MRRSTTLAVSLALIASVLGLASAASATPPGDTPDVGNLGVTPDPPIQGEPARLAAYFPDGTFTVTFYKKTGDTTWEPVGSDETGRAGNAFLDDYVFNGEETIYARKVTGGEGRTEERTITPITPPPVTPGPDVGNIYTSPTTYVDGDDISVIGNFASGAFTVSLYQETEPNTWTKLASKQSNSYGNAYFPYEVDGTSKLFARKDNGDSTEVLTITPSPEVDLGIQRDCTGNECAGTATASASTDPVVAGRQFQLQYQGGSGWVNVGEPAATGAEGKVQIQFPLTQAAGAAADVPQWTPRTYRLHSPADASGPEAISNTRSFMPGPTKLGRNVLRVDVKDGIFPTRKGPKYGARATASQDGVVDPVIDDFKVDDFGVRGTSTAGYTKKPYALKFDDSPKGSTVFGMGADKSWTLLASFLDQTFVRDKVGLDLGRRINEDGRWTPDSRFVELFVNDQYRGSYLMTESVKIDGDRVDVDKETGMIMEVDNALSSAIDFMSTIGEIVFAFKDPDERKNLDDGTVDPEGVTDAKVTAVKNRINAFEKKLYSSSGRDEYETYLDEEAAIDFMFVKEFTKDNDSDFNSSHYFSWDQVIDPTRPLADRKFHFGPAWDFDRSAGNVDPDTTGHKYVSSPSGWMLRGTGTPSDSGRQLYRTHWFVQLFKDSGFKAAVEARWAVIKDEFRKVHLSEVAALKEAIGVGAYNDRKRWANEPKRYRSHGSYDNEIAFVTEWYKDRYNWMNGQLS